MSFDLFRRHWLRLLRVPTEPTILPGEASPRIFRAAPRYFTWKLVVWGTSQFFGAALVLIFDVAGTSNAGLFFGSSFWTRVLTTALWGIWFLQLAGTYILIRLDYEQRWYILTDRSLRIREGVLSVTEKTMTFANIQHLTVRQGPLQRILGISDLVVRTAGGGGGMPGAQGGQSGTLASTHIGYFRGVDNAEEIRTAIRDRIRLHRDAGLGDPDDAAPEIAAASAGAITSDAPVVPASSLVDAIRALGTEACTLREALEIRRPVS